MTLAGCIITDPDGRILLLHRNTPKRVQWEIPGGKIAEGEDASTAALREVEEELGLKVRVVKIFGAKEFSEADIEIHYTWLQAEVISGEPKIKEPEIFDNLRFFSIQELKTADLKLSSGLEALLPLLQYKSQLLNSS